MKTMAEFRIETDYDPATGRYYAEFYHSADARAPTGITKPIYPSHEAARADAIDMIKKVFPDKPLKVRD
jgi:hypothetical protein